MRLLRRKIEWPKIAFGQCRYRAAIAAAVIGLALGLIDVNSIEGDWFSAEFAYLIAAFALGFRYKRRAWQAWLPLTWSLYLAHRAAMAYGYRQPYVEKDAATALLCLGVVLPVSVGLGLGGLIRFLISATVQGSHWVVRGPNEQMAAGVAPETSQQADTVHQPSQQRVESAEARTAGRSLSVRKMMVIIAVIGIHLATVRFLLLGHPFFGFGTIYSDQYSESQFDSLRVGMSRGEVEGIAGPPLRKVPWNQDTGTHDEEMWYYSDQPNETANFHRRWVLFENGKIAGIINDFWVD